MGHDRPLMKCLYLVIVPTSVPNTEPELHLLPGYLVVQLPRLLRNLVISGLRAIEMRGAHKGGLSVAWWQATEHDRLA